MVSPNNPIREVSCLRDKIFSGRRQIWHLSLKHKSKHIETLTYRLSTKTQIDGVVEGWFIHDARRRIVVAS
jgi:hypothetical protein